MRAFLYIICRPMLLCWYLLWESCRVVTWLGMWNLLEQSTLSVCKWFAWLVLGTVVDLGFWEWGILQDLDNRHAVRYMGRAHDRRCEGQSHTKWGFLGTPREQFCLSDSQPCLQFCDFFKNLMYCPFWVVSFAIRRKRPPHLNVSMGRRANFRQKICRGQLAN